MLSKSMLLKFISLFMVAIILSQCTKVVESQIRPSNRQLLLLILCQRQLTCALAKNQPDPEQQNLLLMAGGRFINDGQWQDGIHTLSQTRNLSLAQVHEKSILLAKAELIREQPRSAITQLASVGEVNSLPHFYQVQYHEVLAAAYELLGNANEAITERIKLEHLLEEKEKIR